MLAQLATGVILGATIGGIVGYAGRCVGGGCPLTCNPIGGIITGALIGFLLASSLPASREQTVRRTKHPFQETRAEPRSTQVK
jgi:hypothetical protein